MTANAVAVVGSRAATSYGMEQASDLSRELTSMGQTIVSGLAVGVDQAAHRGALAAGGPTIAVMPCGVDRPYPTAHAQLLVAIAQRGLVVSETPPGTDPTRTRFLARNRIVAGLSEGTVVVEGAVRRGALNTAHWTTNLHRPLMGMPGPVTSAASTGVNQLIRSGRASMVTNAQEVLTDLTAAATVTSAPPIDESCVPATRRKAPDRVPPTGVTMSRSAPSR
ncbi:MAG: DNA-protecting protein DprA [Friedmanniella sp.]|nr:DNA-protecting protein DprA [Friedmanniella sp.]